MDDKKKGIARTAIELTDDDLDNIAGGKMDGSLYTQARNMINKSGIATVLKDKALRELDSMRVSGQAYTPDDVFAMLRKRGVK